MKQADEDVDEIEEDLNRDKEGVHVCGLNPGGTVEVEDDERAENRDADPIEQIQRRLLRRCTECRTDHHRKLRDDEEPQSTEQPDAPAFQTAREQRTKDTKTERQKRCHSKNLEYARGRVQRHNRPEHEAHGCGDEEVAKRRERKRIGRGCRMSTKDAEQRNQERPDHHRPGKRHVTRHVRRPRRGENSHRRPNGDREPERLARNDFHFTTSTIPDIRAGTRRHDFLQYRHVSVSMQKE